MAEIGKEIYANISALDYKELKEKYKAVDIDGIIEKKVKYYRLKPFKGRSYAWWCDKIKEYIEFVNEDAPEEELKVSQKKAVSSVLQSYYNKKDLAKEIWEITPYFYDKSKIWWIWDKENYKWKMVDDKDILNLVEENSDANTVNSKEKGEIIESMEQYGRKNIPKPIKKTWIQFKDIIIDIKNGEEFKAIPNYFVTNPIPWALHKERFVDTPIMDKIFEEWVGKEYTKTLYEIIAYCLIPDYPIHRLFCLIGGGLNGKGCFLRLLKKFVGEDNITSTELDTLLSSRFEVTRLHKKLVCMLGETNFNEMAQTSILKKLTGQDTIGFEYKNKNPFIDDNYAKIIIATNNLPTTTDKTIGFYRRWCIIDFPNQFSEKKDILDEISNEEYEILAVKSLIVLKDLLDKREFYKEGTIEERMKRYEDRSDPLTKFLKEFTEEDPDGFIFKRGFEKKFNNWCSANKFRNMSEVTIGKIMKERGIHFGLHQATWLEDGIQKRYHAWLGLKWKGGEDNE
jgi:P4 family phage/plasmid primase-like protien